MGATRPYSSRRGPDELPPRGRRRSPAVERRTPSLLLRFFFVFIAFVTFNFDRALGEDGRQRANGGKNGRKDGADHADGQRKLDNRSRILLDDDAAHVPLVQHLLYSVHELLARDLERFLPGALRHHRYNMADRAKIGQRKEIPASPFPSGVEK